MPLSDASLQLAAWLTAWLLAGLIANIPAALADNSAPKSPLPGLVSDKAYARSVAKNARLVAALIAQPTANHLAAAALMSRFPTDDNRNRALDLIAQAEALAPDRPELVYLHLELCEAVKCDSASQIEAHLKAVDSGNGFAWMPDLQHALAENSESAVTDAIVHIGAAERNTLYWNTLSVMVFDALADVDKASTRLERGTIAFGLLGSTFLPLQPLSKACRAEQLSQPERRVACEQTMSHLEHSSSFITQSLSLGIQKRWWPDASVEQNQIVEKRRQLHYIMYSASRLRLFRLNRDMQTRMDAARRCESEEEVATILVKSYGLPIVAPAHWKDPWAS